MSSLLSADRRTAGQADKRFHVQLFHHDRGARIRPKGFLGDELFDRFRTAIAGARYDRTLKANIAPLDKIPGILKRLREADFVVDPDDLDPKLRHALQVRTAQQWNDLKSVQDRIDRIDAEIFAATKKERGIGEHLFEYQKIGAQWLALRRTALLADSPGVGKTRQGIVAAPAGAPVLVVGPAAAKGIWLGEMERCRPLLRAVMLSGRSSFRWPSPGEMLVTNYDILPNIHVDSCSGILPPGPCEGCLEVPVERDGKPVYDAKGKLRTKKKGHLPDCDGKEKFEKRCPGCAAFLGDVHPGTVVIFDEVHLTKSSSSARALRSRGIARAIREHDGFTWGFSGTPMENGFQDLWYVMETCGVAHECFGDWNTLKTLCHGKETDYGQYTWGIPDGEIAERIQRGCLRRMKADVLSELPAKRWGELVVEIDKKTMRECDRFLSECGGLERFYELLTPGSMDFEIMSAVRKALATAKIPALLELVSEYEKANEPVVVFSMHTDPIFELGRRKGWKTITGDVDALKRKAIVDEFQTGKLRGLACTIQAAGVALTLTRASHGVFVDLSWKPTDNEQAEDRLHRLGQKKACVYTIMKADHPLDRRVVEILVKKRQLIAASVDASSVLAEVPPNAFEEQIRAEQQEIAQGRAVRRMADGPEEEKIVEGLHTLKFRAEDDRVALSLAEQAYTIGLSDKQWAFAREILERGSAGPPVRGSASESESENKIAKDDLVKVDGDPHLHECARVTNASKLCDCGSVSERSVSAKQEEETTMSDTRIERALLLVQAMSDEERLDFMDQLSVRWCPLCAVSDPSSDHDCTVDDEDDEDLDPDDDDEGEGDEEEEDGEDE